uniref:Uncharacterized protein n=1 Tax=Rhodnius prolixus TaxID=13249 RepID=T1HW28_RHOPR
MSADSGGQGLPDNTSKISDKSSFSNANINPNVSNTIINHNNNTSLLTNMMEVISTNTDSDNNTNKSTLKANKRPNEENIAYSKSKVHVQEANSGTLKYKNDYVKNALKNRYKVGDKGPYIVNLEGNKGNLGKVHRMAIGKWLLKSSMTCKDDILNIEVTGKNRMKIETNSAQAANELLKLEILKEREISAYIPNFRIHCTGVIRDVDIDLEEEEILLELVAPVKPTNIRRLTRKILNGSKEIIKKILVCIVTFDSQSLPQFVSLYGVRCRVEAYIPPEGLCNKNEIFNGEEERAA